MEVLIGSGMLITLLLVILSLILTFSPLIIIYHLKKIEQILADLRDDLYYWRNNKG